MGLSLSEIVQRINLHIERQRVISSNIANSDTPNYRAKDINFDKALNLEVNGIAKTHEKHITGGLEQSGAIITKKEGAWKDGNNVEINEEVAKMSDNQLLHEFYMARFSGYVKKFKQVIKA